MSTLAPYVINTPHKVSRTTHTLYNTITFLAWLLYAYLWLPVVTLIAWVLGARTGFIELYVRDNALDPTLVVTLPLLLLLCAAVLIGWAEWNRLRFSDRDRRGERAPVTQHDVFERLGADSALGQSLAHAKNAVLTLDDHGTPTHVRVDRPLAGALG